jgi:hypothetical protein
MLIVALIIFAGWALVSMLVLSLCVAAGRADRALEMMLQTPAPEVFPGFVAGFAEPQPEVVPVRPDVRSHTRA